MAAWGRERSILCVILYRSVSVLVFLRKTVLNQNNHQSSTKHAILHFHFPCYISLDYYYHKPCEILLGNSLRKFSLSLSLSLVFLKKLDPLTLSLSLSLKPSSNHKSETKIESGFTEGEP